MPPALRGDRLLRAGRFPQRRAAAITRQIAAGLAASHGVGIAHRDIKPANVMVVEEAADQVKLIDFGFARIDFNRVSLPESGTPGKPNPPALTTGTMIFGTPAYMAPETVGGMSAVDYRSDLYALGVIAFEMLTGERPFDERDVVRLLRRKNREPAPRISDHLGGNLVSPGFEALVARLLEREPDDRFASAQQVVEAIDMFLGDLPESRPDARRAPSSAEIELGPTQEVSLPSGEATPSAGTSDTGPARKAPAGRSWVWLSAIVAVAALGVAGVALLRSGAPGGPTTSPAESTEPTSRVRSEGQVASAPGAAVSGTPEAPVASSAAPAESVAPAGALAEPSRADRSNELRAELWKAYAQKRWKAGAEALLALVDEDPAVFERPDMIGTAASLAVAVDNVDAPLAVKLIDALGTAKDAGSVDVLYQIVRTVGAVRRSGKRAESWLKKDEVVQRATPAARVAIELQLAGCAQKRPLFQRAATEGDERGLAELQALFAMRCGRRKPGPCCFKRDPALSEALTALNARVGKK